MRVAVAGIAIATLATLVPPAQPSKPGVTLGELTWQEAETALRFAARRAAKTAKEDKWSSDHLDVYRYVVKNNSFRHLDNVVLRVQFSASKCWYAGVEDAGSLDERSIKSTVENGEVSYEISSFPAREKIVFVLACHGHALRGRDMKGGSSKYKLLKRYEYVSLLASRISSFALGAAVVYFFGKVVLWAQS